jgi:hypothetical protein
MHKSEANSLTFSVDFNACIDDGWQTARRWSGITLPGNRRKARLTLASHIHWQIHVAFLRMLREDLLYDDYVLQELSEACRFAFRIDSFRPLTFGLRDTPS